MVLIRLLQHACGWRGLLSPLVFVRLRPAGDLSACGWRLRTVTGGQPLRVPFSVPVKRAPAPNVWKLAGPDSPANWPVPPANAMLSSSTKGPPYEMVATCWCAVFDSRGQKRPVSGPEMVLSSDCSVIVKGPSTLKQRPFGSKAGPKAYAQSAAPSPASCMVPHSSATPEGHRPAKSGLTITVENEP